MLSVISVSRGKMQLVNFYSNILLNLIINQFHKNERCLFIFSDINLDYRGNIPAVKIKVVNDSFDPKLIFHNYGCQNVVIYAQKPVNIFVQFETQIRLNMERFNKRKFLIAPRSGKNFEEDFFGLAELNYVCELLVVLPESEPVEKRILNISSITEEIVFQLKTHKYVGSSDNNKPVLLDKWFSKNQSFLFGNNLYPDKITNQQGRSLRMSTFNYKPFVVIGAHDGEYYGSEMLTAVTFGVKHNMTPIVVNTKLGDWGEIAPDYTASGILGNIVMDKADCGFAALYQWENCYHYLDLSTLVLRAGATLLVPAPRLKANLMTPLLSYTPKIWLAVIIIFSVSITILSIILFFYNHSDTLGKKYPKRKKSNILKFVEFATIVVTKPSINQSLSDNETPVELSSKLIMILMLILSLFLTNIYSSGLAAIMTLPTYEGAINTAAEFADCDVPWIGSATDWTFMIRNSSHPQDIKVVRKFQEHTYPELRKLSLSGAYGFVIERLPFGSFGIEPFIQDDAIDKFRLLHDDLYWAFCVIMTRKSSVLLPAMDKTIRRIFESGIVKRWQEDAVALFMDYHVQSSARWYSTHLHSEPMVVPLKFGHVGGAFVLLSLGCSVSLAVFIVEILKHRQKKYN